LNTQGIVAPPPYTGSYPHIGGVQDKAGKKGAVPETAAKAWRRFTAQTGKGWSARWNPVTCTPHLVTGRPLTLPGVQKLTRENIEAVCRDFIASHADLLRAEPGQLKAVRAIRAGGRWHTAFQQMHKGVPVVGGQLRMSFGKDDRLIMFGSDIYPDAAVDTNPKVSRAKAVSLALTDCELPAGGESVRDVQLCIVPIRRPQAAEYVLCWKLHVHQPAVQKKWEYLIDATRGKIISRRNVLVYEGHVSGTVRGEYVPEFPSDGTQVAAFPHENVKARGFESVIASWDFDTDPGWTTEGLWAFGTPSGAGGEWGFCTDPNSGYTGNYVYGYNLEGDYEDNMPACYLTTTAIDCSGYGGVHLSFMRWLGVESAQYDNASIEVSNDGNNWTTVWTNGPNPMCDGHWTRVSHDISAVADGRSTVYIRWVMGPSDEVLSYCGWNIDDVKVISVRGQVNMVQTRDDGSYGVVLPWNPSIISSVLDGLYCDIDYQCGPEALFEQQDVHPGSVVDITWDSGLYNEVIEPSMYRHVNYIHDYYTAMDPALSDSSPSYPSGLDYPMGVTVQLDCVYGYCNAFWDGEGMTFGRHKVGSCDDFGLYAEVIYHEYTHAVTSVIYDGIDFPYRAEPGAMNEAWSDYFGCALTPSQRPFIGDGGLIERRPAGFRTLDNDYRREIDFSNQVHFDSQMFTAALWEIRQMLTPQIGEEAMDQMVHFTRYAHAHTFEEYLLALLVEDDTRYGDGNLGNGTPHCEVIYTAFGKHGMGGLQYLAPSIVVEDISGNANGKLDPGETVSLSLSLTNGWANATNVSARLVTTDPFVKITKEVGSFPDVSHGGLTGNGADAFVLSLHPTCPKTHTIQFTLNVTANGPYAYSRTCLLAYPVAPAQLVYDDGLVDNVYMGYGSAGGGLAVRMTAQTYPCHPEQVRFFSNPTDDATVTITVWDDNGPNGLPGTVLGSLEGSISASGDWFDVDISSLKLIIDSGSFYVGWIEGDATYYNGMDMDPPYSGRSWIYYPQKGWVTFEDAGILANLMVRVRCSNGTDDLPVKNVTNQTKYDGIQVAIAAAADGDEIAVARGVYYENINFMGKKLTVRSTDPHDKAVVAGTVIYGDHRGPTVTFASGENESCALRGFTIAGGSGHEGRGGGILCTGLGCTGPTISDCIIADNDGSGVYAENSSPRIINCTVVANEEAGIEVWSLCHPEIANCIIAGNRQNGILAEHPKVTNCTIVRNTPAGINGFWPVITNCIIRDNTSHQIKDPTHLASVTYSNVQGGWQGLGNIDTDPCFVDPPSWEPIEALISSGPSPADGAVNVGRDATLSWSPGKTAVSHDVYFGTDFDSVRDANTGSSEFMGNQDSNQWDPYYDGHYDLKPRTAYHWRVDEVTSGGGNLWKGAVWGFTTWDANLVGWWKFDEGEGSTAADSANENNGTITGEVSWVEGHDGGYALGFGDGQVTVPDADELRLRTQLSVSAWIYFSSSQSDIYASIISKGNEDNETFSMGIIFGGILVFTVRDDSGGAYTIYGGFVPRDRWVHLAGVCDRSIVSCYVNGQRDTSAPAGSIRLHQNDMDLTIGNTPDRQWPFTGIVDEVRIYNRGLLPQEVQALYREHLRPLPPPVIPSLGDYHLKSEGWRWASDANQWTRDGATSRCIDAGNPGFSLREEVLVPDVDPLNVFGRNLRINMGAFGGTAEASIPPHGWALLADLNNDGTVDSADLARWLKYWLGTSAQMPADLDRNQTVDMIDLALFTRDWLLETTWH
jgi:parallel beta-helix repeat protein